MKPYWKTWLEQGSFSIPSGKTIKRTAEFLLISDRLALRVSWDPHYCDYIYGPHPTQPEYKPDEVDSDAAKNALCMEFDQKVYAKYYSLAVLISGRGSTLHNLLAKGFYVDTVISSNPDAGGLDYAYQEDVRDVRVVERSAFSTTEDHTRAIFDICRQNNIRLVCLAGFIKRLCPIPADFQNKVMNIHPSLLPSFGGKGYYGSRVHRAVLDRGVKISGCTVHYVDDELDHGPIILQQSVVVRDDDTPDTLAQRIGREERFAYPKAIRLHANEQLQVRDGKVLVNE